MEKYTINFSTNEIYEDKYLIIEQISEGKHSLIYKAFDLENEKLVAIKLMK
jgi:serine/threonine protein kinase